MPEPDALPEPDATASATVGPAVGGGFSFVVDGPGEARRQVLRVAAIAAAVVVLIAAAMGIGMLLAGGSAGSIGASVRLAGSGLGSLRAGGVRPIGLSPLEGAAAANGPRGPAAGSGPAGATQPPAHAQAATTPLPPSPPVRIWIPSIGVTSGLVRLGLEPDGTLQVPSEFGVAGWWAGGPSPGEKGAAVIVGHVDSTAGPGVFFRLPHLRPGAVVWVSREDQAAVEFVVQRIEQVPKTRFPTKEVYGPQPNATLRLVTCGGAFDHSTGHYVDNVIVFASAAH